MDWTKALKYAGLVKIAESVRPDADYQQEQLDAITAAGYTLLQTMYGDDLATDIDPRLGIEVSYGFVALSASGECVAAIRGTDNIWEWVQDAKFPMIPTPAGRGLVEDGFSSVYRSLRLRKAQPSANDVTVKDFINGLLATKQATRLTICGHSLGGALATLLAIDVWKSAIDACYTFASPRVGDHIFSDYYNKWAVPTYRVENRFDLVPKLPPILPLPYEHVAEKYELKGSFSFNAAEEHHLATYISLMQALILATTYLTHPAQKEQDGEGDSGLRKGAV
ncbi:MAG: hypothetical protein WBA09_22480 [Candidatus Acidiferrum sp.]